MWGARRRHLGGVKGWEAGGLGGLVGDTWGIQEAGDFGDPDLTTETIFPFPRGAELSRRPETESPYEVSAGSVTLPPPPGPSAPCWLECVCGCSLPTPRTANPCPLLGGTGAA